PAEFGHVGFGPGVAGVLLADVVIVAEVAGDAAGRNAEAARRRDENMRQVLTGAVLARKGLRGRGGWLAGVGLIDVSLVGVSLAGIGFGGPVVAGHVVVQALERAVQELEHVAAGGVAVGAGEGDDLGVRAGERGLAQKQAWREAFDGAAHDALGV